MRVELRRAALAEFLNQLDWLMVRSPPASRRAKAQIDAILRNLADFPETHPLKGDGYREATVNFGRDGFIVRYRVIGETIYVLRIFHGRQNRPD